MRIERPWQTQRIYVGVISENVSKPTLSLTTTTIRHSLLEECSGKAQSDPLVYKVMGRCS